MKQVVLNSLTDGPPQADNFSLIDVEKPAIGDGEVLLRTLWLSLDPMIRFSIDKKALTGPNRVNPGDVIYGGTVTQVEASKHPDFNKGEYLCGRTGWREYATVNPDQCPLRKIDPYIAPLSTALGILGMPGQTAHASMTTIGRVTMGETVVVSSAAGAVGSTAGQIGKMLGARVVGIAGGPQKCASVKALGFDACVDYKATDFSEQLKQACPDGVDVYIENVGGNVTQAVLPLCNYRARMPVVGFTAYYDYGIEGPGPDKLPGFMRLIMNKGLEIKGFGGALVGGQKALDDMRDWYQQGFITNPETIIEGIESAPEAFINMFQTNDNVGKLLIKISSD